MRERARRNRRLALLLGILLAGAGGIGPDAVHGQEADPFAACEARFHARPDDYDASYCFYTAASEERRWVETAARLEALLEEEPGNGWSRLTLAHVYWRLDPERAEATYRAAAERFQEQEHAAGEVLARTNLYAFLTQRGEAERAAAEVDRVVEVAARTPDPIVQARALVLEADHLRHRDQDLETAYRLLRQAESRIFAGSLSAGDSDEDYRLGRACLTSLGAVCFRLGRYGEARRAYARLEALAEKGGDDYARALFQYNQANTYLAEMFELPAAGSRERLITMHRQALATAREAGHRSAEMLSMRNLGELLSPIDATREEAQHHLERCAELAAAEGREDRLAACRSALGAHLTRWGEPRRAAALFEESLEIARQAEDAEGVARVLELRMRASWTTGPRAQALADTEAALDAVEALRELQQAPGGRAGLFAAWSDFYAWPAGRLLEAWEEQWGAAAREDLERAFRFTERLRARVLLEVLADSRAGAFRQQEAPELASARGDLVRTQRRLLDPTLEAVERRRLLRELESAELAEAAAQQETGEGILGAETPDFATLSDVESALADDEALLSFQVALWQDVYGDFGGGSWLLASTRGGTRVYRLPDRAALRPAIRLFSGLFDARDGSEAGAATHLYQQLLAAALRDLPPAVKRLVIVPDGDLHHLPFAALRAAADAPPLAQRYLLSRVPSATLWLRWRRAAEPGGPAAVLALADPMPMVDGGHEKTAMQEAARQRQWGLAEEVRLGALPHAREEGRAVVRHVGGSSRLLTGAEATEQHLKSTALESYGVLHFATHAVIDDKHPQRSAVLLAPGAATEDGLLQPRDIAGLDLHGHVVVLSTCQSASGAVLRGEGVLSLARAFFEAGASTVVGSLWPLRDDEAAALFDRFYHHLSRGRSVAAALANARDDRMRAGAPAAAWAGVVVLGDGDRVPVPGGRPTPPPPLILLLLAPMVLIAWLLWYRFSRRP